MSRQDRPTPREPLPAVKVPRPAQQPRAAAIGTPDEQRVAREQASVARRLQPPARPIRLPDLPTRHDTPRSGGIEAQPGQVEIERRARVQAEADSPASFPPKVEQRRQSPMPISVAPATDQAIGRGIRLLLGRAWPILLAAVGLGGGATAVLKPSAQPEKVDATAVRVTNVEQAIDAQAKRVQAVEDYARELARVNRCLRRQQSRVNETAMPAPDHMGSARKPEPWVDDCPSDPKPP